MYSVIQAYVREQLGSLHSMDPFFLILIIVHVSRVLIITGITFYCFYFVQSEQTKSLLGLSEEFT